jgi:hypothetical protein
MVFGFAGLESPDSCVKFDTIATKVSLKKELFRSCTAAAIEKRSA